MHLCKHMLAQLCQTVCNSMNYSPPGSSIHGDSPGKNTGVGCHSSSGGPSQPRDQIHISWVSCTGRWTLSLSHQGSPLVADTIKMNKLEPLTNVK